MLEMLIHTRRCSLWPQRLAIAVIPIVDSNLANILSKSIHISIAKMTHFSTTIYILNNLPFQLISNLTFLVKN